MFRFLAPTLVLAALATQPAHAGAYADAMGHCLMDHASQKDRIDLIRWTFVNAALHPEVANLATIAPEARQDVDRAAAQVVQRLIFDSCRNESGAALRSEGPAAVQQAFQMLAQLTGDTLVASPAVSQGFANVLRYVDMSRFPTLLMP